MHDKNIRTGRTFRTILKALTAASEGKTVVLLTYSNDYAKELCSITHNIANNYCTQTASKTLCVGQGTIKFMSKLERRITLNVRMIEVVILRDHYKG